ncbi:uncharacterized protein METZ01_LOCUS324760 [marine metagenome]|uniref:Xylose isomerase-like TIM barrel domain-containing protein n=1 Tax=marine metagenome TaxID=408172 RepID=A0A382PFA4_9ZZZZ
MARIPIALQLYSVREDCGKDLPGTLKAVADMGYEGVEFAGYYDRSAEELRQMCDELKLVVVGTHARIDTLLGDELEVTVAFNRTLGHNFLIVPGLADEYRATADAWRATASTFNEIAAKAAALDARVGYHNHRHEFETLGGEIPWDIFCAGTDVAVITQLDVGHCMRGGGDPVAALHKYAGRAQLVHVKEFDPADETTLVGDGVVPWDKVFEACETVGATEWYVVEHERYAAPPLECVDGCLRNLLKIRGE